MPTLEQILMHLILGQKGGKNRIQIIELLKDRPYNPNQIAEVLNINYRTVKHHLKILTKVELICTSNTGGYGEVYLLSKSMEDIFPKFEEIKEKFEYAKDLMDFTTSPDFFQNVVEQTHDAVVIIDRKSHLFFLNKSGEILYGIQRKEVIGNVFDLLADGKTENELFKLIDKGKQVWGKEVNIRNKNNEILECTINFDAVRDKFGKILGYSAFIRNISRRKKSEIELMEAKDLTEYILDTVRKPLIQLDEDLRIISANRSFYKTFKLQKKDTEGKRLRDLGNGQLDIPELREMLLNILLEKTTVRNYKVEHNTPKLGKRTIFINARQVTRKVTDANTILLALEYVTKD